MQVYHKLCTDLHRKEGACRVQVPWGCRRVLLLLLLCERRRYFVSYRFSSTASMYSFLKQDCSACHLSCTTYVSSAEVSPSTHTGLRPVETCEASALEQAMWCAQKGAQRTESRKSTGLQRQSNRRAPLPLPAFLLCCARVSEARGIAMLCILGST